MTLVSKSFSEIVTFSRSSNATRVGPTGVLEYAPHNLLTYSEQFDNAAWGKTGVSATANLIAAPNGTVTADLLAADGVPNNHDVNQLITTGATTISVSAYVKNNSAGFVLLSLNNSASGSDYSAVSFNVSTGVAGGVVNSGGFSSGMATITSVGNGWYRISLTATSNAASNYVFIGVSDSINPSYGPRGRISFTTSVSFYLWGAQLSVGPYALDYVPTTSAAVYGPRFDYDGSGVTIVEPVSTNLLLYSQEFENAAWVKSTAGDTVTANAGVAPDGTTTADKLVADTTSTGAHRIYQSVSTSGVHTFSVFAKAAGYSSLVFTAGSNNWVYFNLAAGTVSSSLGTGWSAATIVDAGNGWYRCTATTSNSNTVYYIGGFNGVGTNGNASPVFAGNGTDGIFIWGAQLEVGSTATAYMVSGASNGFRAVPVVSGSATPKGLLVEESRTNLLTYSEQFDNAAWAKGGSGVTQTVTANAGAAPDGTVNADQVTLSRSNASTDYSYLIQAVTLASTAVHAAAVYMKAATSGDVGKQVALWQYDGTVKNVALITLTADWQRYSPLTTSTLTSGANREPLCIGYRTTAEGGGTQTGSVSFLLWGAQAELGSFSTSYIPTLASAVTRTADVASVNTLSPWFNATEGTIYTEAQYSSATQLSTFYLGDGTTDNAIWVGKNVGGSGTTFAEMYVRSGGANQGFPVYVSNVIGSTAVKIAATYKANDFRIAAQNILGTTDTTGTIPACTQALIGQYLYSNDRSQHIKRIAYYPRALTNAELQALTA